MQFSRVEPRSQLALSFLFICCSIKPALAHDHFNPLSLENDEPGVENVDLSVFEKGGRQKAPIMLIFILITPVLKQKILPLKIKNQQIISSPYSHVLALNNSSSGA